MREPVLNRALILESPQRSPDGMGGHAVSWNALGTIWAERRAGHGGEIGGEERKLSRVAYRIIVRAAPSGSAARPRPGQRFREGERIFDIQAVAEPDSDGRWLICHCEERVSP